MEIYPKVGVGRKTLAMLNYNERLKNIRAKDFHVLVYTQVTTVLQIHIEVIP